MHTGGVSKSMSSLMNVIDRQRYDVSLMIMNPEGALMSLLPPDLRIISDPTRSALNSRLRGAATLLKLGRPFLAAAHCARLCVSLFNKPLAGRIIAKLMPPLDEEFDTIVDFNGQQQLYYMVDKLRAKKKISFFHSDYRKWPYYYSADKIYFPKVDSIWTISDVCVQSLRDYFPEVADRIRLMENISSSELIARMAADGEAPEIDGNVPSILTIGHVCDSKGAHWAIEAAGILKKSGLNFKWYFLGANPNQTHYEDMCKAHDVVDRIQFLGIRTNPYPYIKKATIIAHPSQFEGRSIALDETKLLHKPVVVTNFSTVGDQFTHGHNATICEMNAESIAGAVRELLTDESLREKYTATLAAEAQDNTSEINKLYEIFDREN